MNKYHNVLNVIGRIFVVALFLPAGLSKLSNFQGTVGYFSSLGIAIPVLAVVIAIAVEVLGSAALLVGYQTRAGALLLAIFTLVASILGHPYWNAPADQAFVAQLLFFKNIGVIGGLLALASLGAGTLSLDAKVEAA